MSLPTRAAQRLASLSLLLALAAACGAPASPLPVSFTPLPDGTAPRPFTAEQIAAHFPLGFWNRYRIETSGAPTIEQVTRVTAWSPDRVSMDAEALGPDGQPVGPARTVDAAWTELREHAAFPAAATRLEAVEVELDCGRFDCQRYSVTSVDDGSPVVSRFSFAIDRPGPPVLYTVERNGELTMRMMLIDWGPR